MLHRIQQLIFDLTNTVSESQEGTLPLRRIPPLPPIFNPDSEEDDTSNTVESENADSLENEEPAPASRSVRLIIGRSLELEALCRTLLSRIGIIAGQNELRVEWNSRLRSTAGYAKYPSWKIELNPRLQLFPGEADRTLRHELAHLVAYHRAGRKRIEPHGQEWQLACADLGIPNESPKHRLPLPRNTVQRGYAYQCPNCKILVRRVRPFKHPSACLSCCRKYAGGRFEPSFKFVRVAPETGTQV